MNILIVDDESLVTGVIQKILRKMPCVNVIDVAHDYQAGCRKALSGIFDAILLDVMLGKSGECGIDLLRKIRSENPAVPVVIITVMHSINYLEEAFDLGVNEYITKPFHPRELELRVNRWLCQYHASPPECISCHCLSYDMKRHECCWQGKTLVLTRKSRELLLVFLRHPEMVLSCEFLQEKLWGDYDTARSRRNVRSNVQMLRDALEVHGIDWIRTIRGEGYMLEKKFAADSCIWDSKASHSNTWAKKS